jgi:hypothetical protein
MRYADASAYDVLWSDAVLIEEGAITGVIPEPDVAEPDAPAEAAAPKKRATKKTAAPAARKAPKARTAPKAKAKAKAAPKTKAKKASARGGSRKAAPKKKKGD